MEILKTADQWARDEVFSSKFFILFGIVFVLATIGFWQMGKTEVARSFIYPTLVAGILLLTIGFGLFFSNKSRLANFANDYQKDSANFVKAEILRAEKTMAEYGTIVFKVIPIIIVAAALLIVFVDTPIWRAIAITTIAMMVCILFVDINANARIEAYYGHIIEEDVSN